MIRSTIFLLLLALAAGLSFGQRQALETTESPAVLWPKADANDTYLDNMQRVSAGCSALTDGKSGTVCYDTTEGVAYTCVPSAGDCDSAAEWKRAAKAFTYDVRDYGAVGNGVADDRPAIQAAIDAAAAAGGGGVYCPEGTYRVTDAGSARCITLKSNVRLFGAGYGSVLKLADDQPISVRIITSEGSFTNIAVSNLRLDGNRANQATCNELKAAIFLTGGSRALMSRLWIHGACGDGIQAWGTDDGSEATELADELIYSEILAWDNFRTGFVLEHVGRVNISHSTIETVAASANSHCVDYEATKAPDAGVPTFGPVIIDGLTCKSDPTNDGLQFSGVSAGALKVVVSNSTIEDSLYGIFLGTGVEAVITGNQVLNSVDGVRVTYGNEHAIITGNQITVAGSGNGIMALNSVAQPKNLTVTDNRISCNGSTSGSKGIMLQSPYNALIKNNHVSGCATALYANMTAAANGTYLFAGNFLRDYTVGFQFWRNVDHAVHLRLVNNVFDGGTFGAASVDAMRFQNNILETSAEPYPYLMGNAFHAAGHSGNPLVRAGTLLLDGYVTRTGDTFTAFGSSAWTAKTIYGLDAGSPEGDVTANPGDAYFDNAGVPYKKDSGTGNTGWLAQ